MRGWLGAGILALFLVMGMIGASTMDKAHMHTEELLNQAVEKTLAGQFEQAVTLGMEAKSSWDSLWNVTAIMADHNPMDEVDALFAEMEIYAKTEEEPHFAACCEELVRRVQAVAGAHCFSWWNVL